MDTAVDSIETEIEKYIPNENTSFNEDKNKVTQRETPIAKKIISNFYVKLLTRTVLIVDIIILLLEFAWKS